MINISEQDRGLGMSNISEQDFDDICSRLIRVKFHRTLSTTRKCPEWKLDKNMYLVLYPESGGHVKKFLCSNVRGTTKYHGVMATAKTTKDLEKMVDDLLFRME